MLKAPQLVTRTVDIHAVKNPHDDSEHSWHHDNTPHEERPTSDAHAHAHEGREPPHSAGSFPHEKLEAYNVALAMASLARKFAKEGAAVDRLLAFEIGAPADAEALKRFASRVSAMLTRLMARLDRLRR